MLIIRAIYNTRSIRVQAHIRVVDFSKELLGAAAIPATAVQSNTVDDGDAVENQEDMDKSDEWESDWVSERYHDCVE